MTTTVHCSALPLHFSGRPMHWPSMFLRDNARCRIAALLVGAIVVAAGCARRSSSTSGESPDTAGSSNKPRVEQRLPFDVLAISIVTPPDEVSGLPDTIRIRYKNNSGARGYFDLPSPIAQDAHSEYRVPSLMILTTPTTAGPASAGFLYSPPLDERPTRPSIVVLNPEESIVVEYRLKNFCLFAHAIPPDPEAHFLACYATGTVTTEMRVNLITNWDQIARVDSDPIAVQLSTADLSKHREFRIQQRPLPTDGNGNPPAP